MQAMPGKDYKPQRATVQVTLEIEVSELDPHVWDVHRKAEEKATQMVKALGLPYWASIKQAETLYAVDD